MDHIIFSWGLKIQAICETGFHYRDKSPPMNYVVNISSNMQVFYIYLHNFFLEHSGELHVISLIEERNYTRVQG
jgi:hypothetical protein